MGRRGTKPAPAALKMARGTNRKDRDGGDAPHADIMVSTPPAPDCLGSVGKAKWTETCNRLLALGILEVSYLDAIECYCRLWDEVVECDANIKENGATYINTKTGAIGANPSVNIRKMAMRELRAYQGEFGITPSARSNVAGAVSTKATAKGPSSRRRKNA